MNFMPDGEGLMQRLFSPIPGSVCFARGGSEIKGAELVGNALMNLRTIAEIIKSKDNEKLRKIAPPEANGYVIYRGGHIEFYHIPEKEIEEFMERMGLD